MITVIRHFLLLRVRARINSQIFCVEAPAWQGAKVLEYQASSELLQRRQAGCIGAKNVKLFLREPLAPFDLHRAGIKAAKGAGGPVWQKIRQ